MANVSFAVVALWAMKDCEEAAALGSAVIGMKQIHLGFGRSPNALSLRDPAAAGPKQPHKLRAIKELGTSKVPLTLTRNGECLTFHSQWWPPAMKD